MPHVKEIIASENSEEARNLVHNEKGCWRSRSSNFFLKINLSMPCLIHRIDMAGQNIPSNKSLVILGSIGEEKYHEITKHNYI